MKADAEEFREFLASLPRKYSLDRIRSYWTKYAFHSTDVRNAAKILQSNRILSRARLEPGTFVDAACPSVIAQTSTTVKSNVRFYFRPRTPTQFRSEGIRPRGQYWEDSHCPVPVFFLFDLLQLICRDDCSFSDSNAARLNFAGFCSTAAELKEFDFAKIYSDGSVTNDRIRDITAHKNAELVIPNEIDLGALRLIYCRSAAERETLLHLLPPTVRQIWGNRIAIASTATLFFRKWTFIETVVLSTNRAVISFSPDSVLPEPFEFRFLLKSPDSKEKIVPSFAANKTFTVNFTVDLLRYDLEVYLDGNLAYAGAFDGRSEEIPF